MQGHHLVEGKSDSMFQSLVDGIGCFHHKGPHGDFPIRRQVPRSPPRGLLQSFLVGGTLLAVGSFQGCLLPPLSFSALNILEAGGLQTALPEKADRKPCQFYLICFILISPCGWPGCKALFHLMPLQFSLLLLHSLARKRWDLEDFKYISNASPQGIANIKPFLPQPQ